MLSACSFFVYVEKFMKFRRVLQECHSDLTSCLNVRSLLSHLYQQRLVTLDEFETLQNKGTRNEQNQLLLSLVPYKGEHAYERFLKCLLNDTEHSGHAHLATVLSAHYSKDSIDV